MSALVQFALNHLNTSTSPLVLHSLPPPASSSAASTSAVPALPNPAPAPAAPATVPTTLPAPAYKPNKTAESGVTKLVSIAEIIKRTRADALAADAAASGSAAASRADAKGKGKGKAVEGLHQYTMVGALEELEDYGEGEGEVDEEARREEVAVEWLKGGGGGTKRPRKKHTPFMVVVLSHAPVPELATWPSFLHQPPSSLTAPPLTQPSKKRALATAAADATDSTAAADRDAMDVTAATDAPAEEKTKKKRKRRGKKKKAGAAAEGEEAAAAEEDAGEGAAGVSMEL